MERKFKVGNIVKGIYAGVFVVIGHVTTPGCEGNRITAIDPGNHWKKAPGSIVLPDECLELVQEKQSFYVKQVDGVDRQHMIELAQELAACNPGHPVEIIGTMLSVRRNAERNGFTWKNGAEDGVGYLAAYRALGKGRR